MSNTSGMTPVETDKGTFYVETVTERSDLHRFTRNSYEAVGPDGHRFQQYDRDSLRGQFVRRYGFASKAAAKRAGL